MLIKRWPYPSRMEYPLDNEQNATLPPVDTEPLSEPVRRRPRLRDYSFVCFDPTFKIPGTGYDPNISTWWHQMPDPLWRRRRMPVACIDACCCGTVVCPEDGVRSTAGKPYDIIAAHVNGETDLIRRQWDPIVAVAIYVAGGIGGKCNG